MISKLKMLPIAGVIALGMFSTSSQASTVLAAGSSWEYTFNDPTANSNWNTTTGGWEFGNAPFGNNTGGYASDPLGQFDYATLWQADGADGDDLWLRKAVDFSGFFLPSAQWDLGVDNGYKLYVNGTLLSSGNAEGYTSRWEYSGNFGSLLHAGTNYIALALEDHGGLTAFDMQITAAVDENVPQTPLPAALPLMLSGLGVFGLASRRKKNTV